MLGRSTGTKDGGKTADVRFTGFRGLVPLIVVLGVLSASSLTGIGLVAAQDSTDSERFVRGSPDLDAHVPSNTLVPGQTQELEVVVTNDGEVQLGSIENRNAVTKARNVRATVESDEGDPIEVETGTQALGSVTEDQPKSASFQLTIPDGAEPGEYDLEVELEYSYTWQISDRSGVTSERSRSPTETITVEIDDDAEFIVRNTSTTSSIGDSGTVSLEIENVGGETAYNARVLTESTNGNVVFGESPADEAYAGLWEPGEVKTITHDVAIKDDSSVRPYTLDTAVISEDGDGIEQMSEGIVSGVLPLPQQTFRIEATDSTLRVDDEGWIRGEVTNAGPVTAESVEVHAPLTDPNLHPIEDSYAVGDLEPGETKPFEFHLDVGSEAEPVRKLIDVDVRYRTADRDQRINDDSDVIVDLGERRDEFLVTSTSHEIEAGSTNTVSVEITNNLDEPVTDVEPKLFTDDPLSSSDDTAFVPALEPGETTTVRFEVGVDESAMPKTYATTIDIRYDDADGRSKISDTNRAAITVIEPDDDDGTNVPLVAGVIVLLVVLVLGVYRWKVR